MKQVISFAIRMFVTAVVAWVSGLVLVSAVLYSSNGGADFSFIDIAGFGGIIIIGSAILLLIYYLPAMFWLEKKNFPAVVICHCRRPHLESSYFHPFLLTYREKDGCFGSYFVHADVPNHGSDFWFRISLEPNVSASRKRLTVSL